MVFPCHVSARKSSFVSAHAAALRKGPIVNMLLSWKSPFWQRRRMLVSATSRGEPRVQLDDSLKVSEGTPTESLEFS